MGTTFDFNIPSVPSLAVRPGMRLIGVGFDAWPGTYTLRCVDLLGRIVFATLDRAQIVYPKCEAPDACFSKQHCVFCIQVPNPGEAFDALLEIAGILNLKPQMELATWDEAEGYWRERYQQHPGHKPFGRFLTEEAIQVCHATLAEWKSEMDEAGRRSGIRKEVGS